MKIRSDFPYRFRDIETVWIPLSEGCQLSARLWLPETAERTPVPAILEYLPYRTRDRHRADDVITHPYFAGHGYAAIRVNLRGSGDSDGLLADEYTRQEHLDALEVLRWIGHQPWCNGSVGMIGLSWSGFNALQIAALRPPELKAISTACSTDDRYADDMHYMGGCLLNDNLQYGATLFTLLPAPPDPEIVGDRWRAMWLARLENAAPPAAEWMVHQRRDGYWRHGSVCEDYGRIACPVLAVGGWADGYTNSVLRLMRNLTVPRQAIIGPWGHAFPHAGSPGPAIDFLGEAVRWWDQWLKGIDTGVLGEPMLRAWMQASEPPRARYESRAGRWVAEREWPSQRIRRISLCLADRRLTEATAPQEAVTVCSPQTVGLASGEWCPYGAGPEMPTDQREDDAGSLTFDSEPLAEPVEILGGPSATLDLAADRPGGLVCVRLSDVFPDGTAARVTYGLLNLTHRDGHDSPTPLEPGRRYRVTVKLNDVAYAFPAGHRIRVSVSTAYWPLAWPSPERTTLTVFTGASRLDLPVRPPSPDDATLRPFGPAEGPPPLDCEVRAPLRRGRVEIRREGETGVAEVRVIRNLGAARIRDVALDFSWLGSETYRIKPDDPLSAHGETERAVELRRGDWRVRIRTRTALRATHETFRLDAELDAHEGEARVFSRNWHLTIPRDRV